MALSSAGLLRRALVAGGGIFPARRPVALISHLTPIQLD
jgi:hypothetical protein